MPTSRGYLDDLSHLDIGSTNLIDYPRLWQTRMLMRDMYSQGWADLFFLNLYSVAFISRFFIFSEKEVKR